MTFKKAEMAKTLRSGFSMSETDPLNHNLLNFAIKLGLALLQIKKKMLIIKGQKFPILALVP